MHAVVHSSKQTAWATPEWLWQEVDKFFQSTPFDPCPLEPHFDGLDIGWGEKWYCNPPYGRELPKWSAKVLGERGEGIMLVPARTDTAWFYSLVPRCSAMLFFKGRLKFQGAKHSAPFPSTLFYFGPRMVRFVETFKDCGWIVEVDRDS